MTKQLTDSDKAKIYAQTIPQIEALIEPEEDFVANLANISAALYQVFDWLWVGFYRVQNDELVLGPFQGPIACTRIAKGRGVCGESFQSGKTIIVPNVHEYPNHIACSADSNSEIVIPVFDSSGNIILILDVDSIIYDDFNEIDAENLSIIAKLIGAKLNL